MTAEQAIAWIEQEVIRNGSFDLRREKVDWHGVYEPENFQLQAFTCSTQHVSHYPMNLMELIEKMMAIDMEKSLGKKE